MALKKTIKLRQGSVASSLKLNTRGVFTSPWVRVGPTQSIIVTVVSDVDGKLKVRFVDDKENPKDSRDVIINCKGGREEIHRFFADETFYKIVYDNNDAQDQSEFIVDASRSPSSELEIAIAAFSNSQINMSKIEEIEYRLDDLLEQLGRISTPIS